MTIAKSREQTIQLDAKLPPPTLITHRAAFYSNKIR
jgi:hypothetical protein